LAAIIVAAPRFAHRSQLFPSNLALWNGPFDGMLRPFGNVSM
jgi:hypothetical protein